MSSGTSSKIEKQKLFYKIHAQNSYPVDASIFNLMTIKNRHSEKKRQFSSKHLVFSSVPPNLQG